MTYRILTVLTDETAGHSFSEWSEDVPDWLTRDDDTPDMGAIYRECQSEWGRCTSSVYVDTPDGVQRVGWFFVSRQQYEDTHDPYLRGAWVTIVDDERSLVSVGAPRI